MGPIKPKKIRDLNPMGRKPYGVFSRFEEYFNLLMNAVKITAKEGAEMPFPVETFVKRGLFENGSMGYDKITGKWFYVYGEGVNELGNPRNLVLVTANGLTMQRPASYEDKEDGAYIIKALPIGMSMAELIRETTDFMTSCDVAMRHASKQIGNHDGERGQERANPKRGSERFHRSKHRLYLFAYRHVQQAMRNLRPAVRNEPKRKFGRNLFGRERRRGSARRERSRRKDKHK